MPKNVQSRRIRSISLGAAAACIPLLFGVGACSASGSVASGGHSQATTVGVGATGSQGPTGGSVASGRNSQTTTEGVETTGWQGPTGVSSHIVLPSDTLVSGTTEQGVLVIVNNSGRSLSAGCLRIEVQLVTSNMPLEMHPTAFCPPATLPVGLTKLPFTLKASETVCQVPNGAMGNASYCQSFPPGRYRTQVFPGGNFPDPPAVIVRIVPKI